jgi:hypothetical protein
MGFESPTTPLWDVSNGTLRINPHRGQRAVLSSKKRIVAVNAGVQSGKTTISPYWLYREIIAWDKRLQRGEVVKDAAFLVVSPTYPLLDKKLLPTFIEFFIDVLHIGNYHVQRKVLDVKIARDDGTHYVHKIHFESASKDESLASITAAAIVIDEAGMDSFGIKSWREAEARTGSTGGRILLTTTLYNFGWYKTLIYDRWKQGADHIDVIRFESVDNPFFSREIWDENRRTMRPDIFDMRHRGIYSRPAGQIYDSFVERTHVIPRFPLPKSTARCVGIDPGPVHHCHIWLAKVMPGDDTRRDRFPHSPPDQPVYVVYRNTLAGSTTTTVTNFQHAEEMLAEEDFVAVVQCVGGAASEKYFRADYASVGIDVEQPPTSEVEAGIDAVYRALVNNQLYFFADQIDVINELKSYSRELDDSGEPKNTIANKSIYHRLDALRYIMLGIIGDRRHPAGDIWGTVVGESLH